MEQWVGFAYPDCCPESFHFQIPRIPTLQTYIFRLALNAAKSIMAHLTTATKSLWMSPFLCVLARPEPLIRCLSWQGVLRDFGMGTSLYVRQSSTISALHVDSDIYIAGALTSLWAWQNQLHCCQRAGKWSGMEWDVWGVAGATDSLLFKQPTSRPILRLDQEMPQRIHDYIWALDSGFTKSFEQAHKCNHSAAHTNRIESHA